MRDPLIEGQNYMRDFVSPTVKLAKDNLARRIRGITGSWLHIPHCGVLEWLHEWQCEGAYSLKVRRKWNSQLPESNGS
jgi:hypothetical protein